jgi:hypothetical protein
MQHTIELEPELEPELEGSSTGSFQLRLSCVLNAQASGSRKGESRGVLPRLSLAPAIGSSSGAHEKGVSAAVRGTPTENPVAADEGPSARRVS